jgi:hypothetical protein
MIKDGRPSADRRVAPADNGLPAGAGHPPSSGFRRPASWRTPMVILTCGCLIGVIGFGPRSGLAFFLTPM